MILGSNLENQRLIILKVEIKSISEAKTKKFHPTVMVNHLKPKNIHVITTAQGMENRLNIHVMARTSA